MDEPTDTPPAAGRPPLIAAAASRLSPVQAAWQRYVDHSLYECLTCRRVDGSPCGTAEALYRAYRELTETAFDRLASETSSPHRQ